MKINFKLLNQKATAPMHGSVDAAGYDLTAVSFKRDRNGNLVYSLGIAVEIPRGYFGLLTNRSSIRERDLRLHTGVIDADYRGEIKAVFSETAHPAKIYAVGERVCQLLILPCASVDFVQVEALQDSERGEGGFGSTNK